MSENARRALAVAAAVVLVAVAVVISRSVLGDDDKGGGDTTGGSDDGRPVVACSSDLMAICRALADEGVIAADPPTLGPDGAGDPGAEIAGWITWDPAPRVASYLAGDLADDARWGAGTVIGSSPLAWMAPRGTAACDGAPTTTATWDCLAKGSTTLGVGQLNTPDGLARLTPLAVALDPDDTGEVDVAAVSDILDGPQVGQGSLTTQIRTLQTQGPGAVGSIVGPKVALDRAAGAAQSRDLVVVTPTPATTAAVVLSPYRRRSVGDVAERATTPGPVADAIERAGFTVGRGRVMTSDRAGFMFQVLQEVG